MKLRIKKQLNFIAYIEDDLYIVECKDINLYIFALHQKDIISEIKEQILMMWQAYVKTDFNKLAQDAKELRLALLEYFEEINK
jgi:hypothetical protein